MEVIEYGNPGAKAVLVQPVDEYDLGAIEGEIALIRNNSAADFMLAAVKVGDWNRDLSPWKAPAVFGKDDFGGGAGDTLCDILKYCSDPSKKYVIGGYSLAALFALWSSYRTDLFCAVAAASPSMWFPGFTDYMEKNRTMSRHVYLSLGDREERTRNPVTATVGDEIRKAYKILKSDGTDCVLVWNEGNHFKDAHIRIASAFTWTLSRLSSLD